MSSTAMTMTTLETAYASGKRLGDVDVARVWTPEQASDRALEPLPQRPHDVPSVKRQQRDAG